MSDKPAWAFIVPWELTHQGGVNQVVLRLMRECSQSDRFRPLLIEMDWASREPVEDTHLGFPRVRVRVPSPLGSSLLVANGCRYALRWPGEKNVLRSLAARLQIAVVNPHFPELTAWPWMELVREKGLPEKLILSFHGSDIRASFKKGWLYRNFYRRLLRGATAVVGCSRGLLEEIRMFEPALQNGTAVLNGVSPAGATEGEPALRPSGSPLVVTVGRFEYRKGHDLLLGAFETLLGRYPHAELWIIGGAGEELEKTRALIETRRLSARVKLLVGIEQARVAPTIRQADVFVMTSRWVKGKLGEGLPLAILEAGAQALPVVSTRCCGADEVIDHNRTGVLTPLDDAGELAKAIDSVLSDPERAKSFGLALRDRVERDFTWSRAWREYEALA
ncbi:MAG: glycosyltransferase family 4 protein [Bryobacterales bacterium]|nr:glycosyltransferase family 4 protein [Bryobacterales bacterium]